MNKINTIAILKAPIIVLFESDLVSLENLAIITAIRMKIRNIKARIIDGVKPTSKFSKNT
ncbi:hypothetical protein QUF02_00635 [Lactococcus lactis]|nr:hypothetical protein [Lactococcus lactis]